MCVYIYHTRAMYLFVFGRAGSFLPCRLFSSCGKPGLIYMAVCRLLITVVALVAELRL